MTSVLEPPLAAPENPNLALLSAADRRATVLEQVKDISKRAAEHHEAERARAKAMHRQANRELIAAIEAANAAGIRMGDIARRIGLSYQTIVSLKARVAEWDAEEQEVQ